MKTSPAAASAPSSGKTLQTVLTVAQLLCVAGVVTWAVLLKRDVATAQDELAALRARPAAMDTSSRENATLRARVATLESQLATAAAMAMEAKPTAAPAPAPVPAAAPTNAIAALAASMNNNPAMRNLMASSQRRALENRYADLFATFQFSPEQRTRFIDIMSETQSTQTDVGLKMLSGNLSLEERESLKKQVQSIESSIDQKMREFFGDDAKFATYKQYNEQQSERSQVTALKTSLAESGQTPLSAAQSAALTEIMYTERKSFPFTPTGTQGDPTAVPTAESMDLRLREQEALNNRVADRAAGVLSPEQLADLRRSQAARQEALKVSAEMTRQLLGGMQAAPK